MTRVLIRAGARNYEAIVGKDLLQRFHELLPQSLQEKQCAIICDGNTQPFAAAVAAGLTSPTTIEIAAGERSKSLEQVATVCDEMIAAGLDRNGLVIGVGGGVVGDVSGFVAAIFQRGVPHVQVPTTLLAMVDSAIGGKCGVNTRAGKNLLGAIHQPHLVVCDTASLSTLSDRELRQGLAEIVKHAIIRDAEMFTMLQQSREISHALIQRNIEIKARIVEADERETSGSRALLNFGHTIGHAIERAGNYEQLRHGEAISIGIVGACQVSMRCAGLSNSECDQVIALLDSLGLPTTLPPSIPREAVFEAIRFDKKFVAGQVRFVVTPRIGDAYLASDVTLDDLRHAITHL